MVCFEECLFTNPFFLVEKGLYLCLSWTVDEVDQLVGIEGTLCGFLYTSRVP